MNKENAFRGTKSCPCLWMLLYAPPWKKSDSTSAFKIIKILQNSWIKGLVKLSEIYTFFFSCFPKLKYYIIWYEKCSVCNMFYITISQCYVTDIFNAYQMFFCKVKKKFNANTIKSIGTYSNETNQICWQGIKYVYQPS